MGPDSQQWPPQQGNPGQWPPQQPPQWPPQQPPQWQPQQPPPAQWGPPGQQPQRKRKSGAGWIFGGLCGLAVVIAIAIAASHGSPSPSPAATGAPAGTTRATTAAADTVTYVVTGSSADVTYGPEGSSISATVPLHKTVTIPASPPGYYAIDAQLNGSGSVTCEILVGGKVISKASASGSYEIASCEITQDPFSGAWQDANAA